MRLLDVLEQYPGWRFEEGGEEWSVADYLEEWLNGAEEEDRGPEVICRELADGGISIRSRDGRGEPGELGGVLSAPRSPSSVSTVEDRRG